MSKTSANPMTLLDYSDFAALPFERDRLLDLIAVRSGRYSWPFSREHRITSGIPLADVLRTQPRPINAWAATQIAGLESRRGTFSSASVRPPDIGRLDFPGCRNTVGR